MENANLSKPIRNVLVLIAVVGLILAGWLAGHIFRHLTPYYQHPPIEEIDPHIKNGFEAEGIRRQVVFTESPVTRIFTSEGSLLLGEVLLENCVGNTYYTSLPAKCRSADGRLVRVEENGVYIVTIPGDK